MIVLELDQRLRGEEGHEEVKVRSVKDLAPEPIVCQRLEGVDQAVIPPLTFYVGVVQENSLGFRTKTKVPVTYPALRFDLNPSSRNAVHKVIYPGRTFRQKGALDREVECEVPERTLSFLHPEALEDLDVAKSRTAFHRVSVSDYKLSGFLKKTIKASGVTLAATNVRIEIDLGKLTKHFRFDDIPHCGAEAVSVANSIASGREHNHVC